MESLFQMRDFRTSSCSVLKKEYNISCKTSYSKLNLDEEDETSSEEYKCGWYCYKPQWMQIFQTTKCALLALTFAAFLQGAIVNGILHLIIPTIERRFNLRSIKSGFISGAYDIASLVCLIPITYFGGRLNSCKPHWIGFGVIVMGLGSLVCSLPHFLNNSPYLNNNENLERYLCSEKIHVEKDCTEANVTRLSNFMWLFFLGNLLHGAGASPLYTLGVAFIDESVHKQKSGLYLGMYYTGTTLGIAFGYIIGGYFLKIDEDFWPSKDRTRHAMENKSSIGAWWLGFILLGSLSFLAAIPILAIPTKLPGWQANSSVCLIESVSQYSKIPSAVRDLIKNTSFILLNLAGCCEGVVISGLSAFIPKLLQIQYHLSFQATSVVMGAITIPSAVLGTLVGGGILRKFDLNFIGVLKLCVITTVLSMLCASSFLIPCTSEKIIGINTPYYSDRNKITLDDPCNLKCGCSDKDFVPVCGTNGYTYYSPCYAGCAQASLSEVPGVVFYSNCSCIDNNSGSALSQACHIGCDSLPVFLILMYLSLFFTFVAAIPALTATLRSVEAEQRPLALGLQWMFIRLLGMIPGPLLFGVILDGTCEHWQAPACSHEEGSCALYDHFMISWSMVLLTYGWKSLEIILFFLSIYFYEKIS